MLSKGRRPTPPPPPRQSGSFSFYRLKRAKLQAETALSALTVVLRLVISGLTGSISIAFGSSSVPGLVCFDFFFFFFEASSQNFCSSCHGYSLLTT